jgi:hypothetical protein
VFGEVLTDLHASGMTPDWISSGPDNESPGVNCRTSEFASVVARGGCDVLAICHYFRTISGEIHEEVPTVRDGIEYRTDHSVLLAEAARGSDARSLEAFSALGYEKQDLASHLFQAWPSRSLMLLSFFGDGYMPIYRHRATGIRVPLLLPTGTGDLAALSDEFLSGYPAVATLLRLRKVLRESFDYEGPITEHQFKSNLRGILFALGGSEAYILRPQPSYQRDGQVVDYNPLIEQLNAWVDAVIGEFPRVRHVRIGEFARAPEDQLDANHFDRKVYFRFFQALRDGRIDKQD